jgi:hypothetical protein
MIRFGIFSKRVIATLWQDLQPAPPLDVMISLMEQLDILVVQQSTDQIIIPCMIQISSVNNVDRFRVDCEQQHLKRVALKVDMFPMYAFARLMVQISKQPGFSNATFGKDALSIEYKPPQVAPHWRSTCVLVIRSPTIRLVQYNGHIARSTLIPIECNDDPGWHHAIESIRAIVSQQFQQLRVIHTVVACQCVLCCCNEPQCLFDLESDASPTIAVRCAISKKLVSVITTPAQQPPMPSAHHDTSMLLQRQQNPTSCPTLQLTIAASTTVAPQQPATSVAPGAYTNHSSM